MELKPIYSNQKSFYGKAQVIIEDGIIKLKSYDTVVVVVKDGKPHINGFYSSTTSKHIREFLKQLNFEVGTKKQLEKLYC